MLWVIQLLIVIQLEPQALQMRMFVAVLAGMLILLTVIIQFQHHLHLVAGIKKQAVLDNVRLVHLNPRAMELVHQHIPPLKVQQLKAV